MFIEKNFNSFKNELPTKEIELTTEAYPMINREKLETELKIFYERSEMHEYCKLTELLQFIMENNLDSVLSEITKLIKILLTVPMATSEPERCFSALKRINFFLRSTMSHERLNAIVMLSIEKKFNNMHPQINEKVIDLFAQSRSRRMDFIFK